MFEPNASNFLEAKEKGLRRLPGFGDPEEAQKEEIKSWLMQRSVNPDRSDFNQIKAFFSIPDKSDFFDILAYTQGVSPTDNFEFVARYHPNKHFVFTTDIAGLSHCIKNEAPLLRVSDKLEYKHEGDNEKDKNAVAVYFSNEKLGYIKKIHSEYIVDCIKRNIELDIIVIAVQLSKNDVLDTVFVKINQLKI